MVWGVLRRRGILRPSLPGHISFPDRGCNQTSLGPSGTTVAARRVLAPMAFRRFATSCRGPLCGSVSWFATIQRPDGAISVPNRMDPSGTTHITSIEWMFDDHGCFALWNTVG